MLSCAKSLYQLLIGVDCLKSKQYKKYIIYDNGIFFDTSINSFREYRIDSNGYPWVGGEKVWRVIAELFIPIPEYLIGQKLYVNHKDGNKLNNSVSNLEWCTCEYNNRHARINGLNNVSESNSKRWNDEDFRIRTSKNISKGLKESGVFKFKNNPRFRYLIVDCYGKEYTREELSELIGFSQSYTDAIIKKAVNGNIHEVLKKYKINIVDTKKSPSTIERQKN